ncbi:hypothetical protein [Peribacillus sp. SCS-155]|uniref:hypothetical protein n=1 Tax=Peribacillus sedimenti TaxID=3115297 RepID=UPI003905D0F5
MMNKAVIKRITSRLTAIAMLTGAFYGIFLFAMQEKPMKDARFPEVERQHGQKTYTEIIIERDSISQKQGSK